MNLQQNDKEQNDKEWNDKKQFRDPVYGYIQVPTPYVQYLIDTPEMQRIKGVAQSGLRPLFAAATHDRFSHSIGVYRFAMLLYKSMSTSAVMKLKKICPPDIGFFELKLKEWKNLLAIACLLHDIGHPLQSHSMEFLYDDVFLRFPKGEDRKSVQRFDADEWKRTAEQYYKARTAENPYQNSPFVEAMKDEKDNLDKAMREGPGGIVNKGNYKGSPHERMSAYYILTSGCLRDNINTLCASYSNKYALDRPQEGEKLEKKRCDELDFICRMITGTKYNVPTNYTDDTKKNVDLEYSLRNCVIAILNGTIDADSMDYIMRNSYSSGYETSEVDYYRFCNAFVVYWEHGQFFPAWNKSALSVIGGFINARNYEPQWLYSHPKVVYQDILFKELLMDAVKYIALCGLPEDTVTNCTKAWSDILDGPQSTGTFDAGATGKGRMPERICYAFFPYVLSPFIPFDGGKFIFYRSVDGDMDTFFKHVDLDMRLWEEQAGSSGLKKDEKALIQEFQSLYHEFYARQHKKSLWKSFSEYKRMAVRIAKRLNTDFDTINRYILELIEKGLERKQFHLQADIGDSELKTTKNYQNEIIYFPPSEDEQKNRAGWRNTGINGRINRNIRTIFGRFTPEDCRVKICNIKGKDFSKVQVVIGDEHCDLQELLDCDSVPNVRFPYLFFKPKENEKITSIRKEFFQTLEDYCRQRITDKPVGGNMFGTKNSGVIRDVVHGDISLPKNYQAVIDTPEFQRLRNIKQLATAAQVFPNAGHSRFSHSLGTYYIMTKMVAHFESLCQNQGIHLFNNSGERDIILLAALLHDLGHGPYSHAFESVTGKNHEEWTQDIITDPNTKIYQVLVREFGGHIPQAVSDCIAHKTSGRDVFSFASLYPALISSQLDADRLGYLLRDSYNTAVQFGNVDLQNLISAMRITVIDQEYSVAIDENYLSMVEHFLFGRFKMYETVYYDAYKLFSEELIQLIFQRVKAIIDDRKSEILGIPTNGPLYKLLCNGSLDVTEYTKLDDPAVESCFAQWVNLKTTENEPLSTLVRAFLYHNRQEDGNPIFQRVRVFYESDGEVQDFLQQVDDLIQKYNVHGFPKIRSSLKQEKRSYAFINVMRTCKMYTGVRPDEENDREAGNSDRNVIWILRENGTVQDVGEISRVLGDEFHKSYLYYSKTIFQKELEGKKLSGEQINEILMEVDKMIEGVHPRHMIEIEEKYSCNAEALMYMCELLPTFTKEMCTEHEGFYMKAEPKALQNIEQEDTYYDTRNLDLHKANCSFRCRKVSKDGKDGYVFTIKRPTNSRNFGGNEQFARFEFELRASTGDLSDEVLKFLRSRLELADLLGISNPTDIQIRENLCPIITIKNMRSKGTVLRCTDEGDSSTFEAEICLDRVTYNRPGAPDEEGKPDWQLELELKSDYLDRILLKKFSTHLREQEGLKGLSPESDSKYKKAHQFLGIDADGKEKT